MKILTGFAVVKDAIGNKIVYTITEVDESGTVISSNDKKTYFVMDEDTNNIIGQLEDKIKEKFD